MSLIAGLVLGALAGWGAAVFWFSRRRGRDGRFLSFIAHEMSSPLASLHMTILNFIQGVFGPPPKEHEPWLQLLKEQSSRLNFLMGGFQDFVHMEFRKDFWLHVESLDLAVLVRETVDGMKGSLDRSGARLELDAAEGLPKVSGDRDRLQRVIASLLEYAKKFRAGGDIGVSVRPAGGGVEMEVRYQGRRIDPSEVAGMLSLYYPAQKPDSRLLPSAGLGLGICRKVVESHRGSMAMEVDDGGASRIRVVLPA